MLTRVSGVDAAIGRLLAYRSIKIGPGEGVDTRGTHMDKYFPKMEIFEVESFRWVFIMSMLVEVKAEASNPCPCQILHVRAVARETNHIWGIRKFSNQITLIQPTRTSKFHAPPQLSTTRFVRSLSLQGLNKEFCRGSDQQERLNYALL